MLGYLIASGRASAYFRHFWSATNGAFDQRAFADDFLTAVLWMLSVAPFLFAAWEIGRDYVAARRMGYELFVGIREVFRRAFGRASETSASALDDRFARPPADNPGVAVVWGGIIAVLVPTFFASFSPDLRSTGGLVWLGVTGVLMGSMMYCRRRAMAYLRDEPGRWDLFREWRLLNTSRYDAAGRVFVRWQAGLAILIPIWWLGGGAMILSRT